MPPAATPGRARHPRPTLPTTPIVAIAVAIVSSCVAPAARGVELRDVRIGPTGGAIVLDGALRNYRWDTSARPAWGVATRSQLGPAVLGGRIWRAATEQSLNVLGESLAPTVRLTAAELSVETRVTAAAGIDLLASGTLGALHLGYAPDALDVDDGTGGTVHVDFAPITEPTLGLGLTARRALSGAIDLSLALGRTWFRLETTHRDGPIVVTEQETFGVWVTHLALSHRITGGPR